MRLALILEKSESYIAFQRAEILKDWDVPDTSIKKISKVSEVGAATLFGGDLCSILHIPTANELKDCVAEMEESSDFMKRLSSGLIITTPVDGRSNKKLRELVEKLGGKVYALTPEANKNKSKLSADLLKDINLSRDARNFLLAYVGDEYEDLISLVRTLKDLSPQQQNSITTEDLWVRLPKQKGAVPPWNIERPLLAGNISETIETYRRISDNSSALPILFILNNKFRLAYKISSLLSLEPGMSKTKIADSLGVKDDYPLKLAMDSAKKYSHGQLEAVVKTLAKAESSLKGGSAASPNVIMEASLVSIHNSLHARF